MCPPAHIIGAIEVVAAFYGEKFEGEKSYPDSIADH